MMKTKKSHSGWYSIDVPGKCTMYLAIMCICYGPFAYKI